MNKIKKYVPHAGTLALGFVGGVVFASTAFGISAISKAKGYFFSK